MWRDQQAREMAGEAMKAAERIAAKHETHEQVCAQRQGAILGRLTRLERILLAVAGAIGLILLKAVGAGIHFAG